MINLHDQTDGNTRPQTLKLPVGAESQSQADGQTDHPVSKEVGWSSNALSSYTPKQTVSSAAETIKDLHDGDYWKCFGDNGCYFRVLCEKEGEVEAEAGVHGEVEYADETEDEEGLSHVSISGGSAAGLGINLRL